MNSGLHLEFDLSGLRGADYNPRRIDAESIDRLKTSLRIIGCAKPIIARGPVIVAGHQRTRALREMGETHAPVYLLPSEASTYDEVRFNQLHNGTDMDTGDEAARVILQDGSKPGFVTVPHAGIVGNTRATGANIRAEVMKLIQKYGPWGACVATESGEIFHAAQYALSCKILGKPLLVYVVPKSVEPYARDLLNAQYGVFSYDNLPRETYIQTFAQMMRLRDGPSEKGNKSPTYETMLIPWIMKNPEARVLDFGCGQGDYVRKLSAAGKRVQGLEFFRRKGGSDALDITAINGMVDALIATLKGYGRFDAVICDYVMNSVDSQQAEEDVLTCLAAFCKPGGMIFFSGRKKERLESQDKLTGNVSIKGAGNRYVEFLDEHGLTALYRKGRWFYQKFHSREDIKRICETRGWEMLKHTESSTAWQVQCVNANTDPPSEQVKAAIDREFNMKLASSGRTLNRHLDTNQAIQCLLSK